MRKGMGKGKGKGYKNIIGNDPKVHSDSAHGRKQPQKIPMASRGIKSVQNATKWANAGMYNNLKGSLTFTKGEIEYGNAKEVIVVRDNPHGFGWVVFKYENRYEPNVGIVRGDMQKRKRFKTKKDALDYAMGLKSQ